jgi:hypothetical protein
MQIPILVEKVPGNGYRARGGEPFPFTAEGATQDEAVARLKAQIDARLQAGAKVIPLEVADAANAWKRVIGMYDENDPEVDEWIKAMQENRRKDEEDPDYL